MRSLFLVPVLGLAGCVTIANEPSTHICHAEGSGQFVGAAATAANGNAIMRATGAAVLRWARPGVMLTMDFRQDRVTVRTGPDGRITAISCG